MNVLTISLVLFYASSHSTSGCEGELNLLQLNSRGSSVSLSPTERIGPNIHRHKLAFLDSNATVSTTEPLYRELAGYWTGGQNVGRVGQNPVDAWLSPLSDRQHTWPPTPSDAKAMLKKDTRIMGYSFEKSHPDVAYVHTSGGKFVPSEDWVSVLRADDAWWAGAAAAGAAKQVALIAGEPQPHAEPASASKGNADTQTAFNWEDPPPDHHPPDVHPLSQADDDELPEGAHEEAANPLVDVASELNVSANETAYPGSFAPVVAFGFLATLCS